jgi:thiamine-phosphate pyrophosphorylase
VRPPLPRVHAITDERLARQQDLDRLAAELAAGGGPDLAFHARGRALTGREHHDLALRLRTAARIFVNDRLDVALAVGALGVQLGRGNLAPTDARRLEPAWWIGVSVHDVDEAWAARTAGADYLLVGPVFATATHPDRVPLATARLAEIAGLGLPVIAIGGVTVERVPQLRAAGVHGVAAIRALWDAADPRAAARAMIEGLGVRS